MKKILTLMIVISLLTMAIVSAKTIECNDGIDNDGDGFIDYPNDPGCNNNNKDKSELPNCMDGLDNNNNGKIDMEDPGCISPLDNTENKGDKKGYDESEVPEFTTIGAGLALLGAGLYTAKKRN